MKRSAALHTDGYIHVQHAIDIPADIRDAVIRQANKKSRAIFNSRNDRKRKQTNLVTSSMYMRKFVESVNAYVMQHISSKLVVSPWVILKSLAGCHEQPAHCDYQRATLNVSDEHMPLAALLAIEPGTMLSVWPKSITGGDMPERIERVVLNMDVGDMVVFRGDLVHAGSGYDAENHRLHAYLDSEYVSRIDNRTWLVKKHGDARMRASIVV